jgi:hypothetical protein
MLWIDVTIYYATLGVWAVWIEAKNRLWI